MSSAPVKSNPEQVIRSPKGRFVKGHSGNPAGRPPGAANKLLTLAREGALELWPSIMRAAKGGDVESIKLVLGAGMPKAKPMSEVAPLDLPESISLADQARAVVQQAARGQITPDQAVEHMAVLHGAVKVLEFTELAERLDALAERVAEVESRK